MTTITGESIKSKSIELNNAKSKLSLNSYLLLFFICLYASNFLNKGIMISFILFPIALWMVITKGITKRLFLMSFLLILFSVIYGLTIKEYGFTDSVIVTAGYLIAPITMYLIGYSFINGSYKNSYGLLLAVTVSTALFSILSIVRTIQLYGSLQNANPTFGGRAVVSLWGENFLSATGMNTYVSLGLALFPLLFIKDKSIRSNRTFKLMIFLVFAVSIYVTFSLGNRTGLLIIIASTIMVFLFSTKLTARKILSFVLLMFLFILGALLYMGNTFGVKDKWLNSSIGYRMQHFSALEDPRFMAWGEALVGVFKNPTGGRKTELSLNYAHNLWLDVGHDAGIIPFILLLAFSILGFLSLGKFYKSKQPVMFKALIIASFTAIVITCFLEPIMQGWFYYFTIFCILLGVIHKHIKIASRT